MNLYTHDFSTAPRNRLYAATSASAREDWERLAEEHETTQDAYEAVDAAIREWLGCEDNYESLRAEIADEIIRILDAAGF